jgi:hypothetical protein
VFPDRDVRDAYFYGFGIEVLAHHVASILSARKTPRSLLPLEHGPGNRAKGAAEPSPHDEPGELCGRRGIARGLGGTPPSPPAPCRLPRPRLLAQPGSLLTGSSLEMPRGIPLGIDPDEWRCDRRLTTSDTKTRPLDRRGPPLDPGIDIPDGARRGQQKTQVWYADAGSASTGR